MTEIMLVEGRAKLLFDGRTYEPSLWQDSFECRNPSDGQMIMSKARWKDQQKWFVSFESAIRFVVDQLVLDKKEYSSIMEYVEEYNRIYQSMKLLGDKK